MAEQGTVRVGTSGWIYRHWRGVFYPPDLPATRWFSHYTRAFDTVEVNNTFYRLPAAATFTAWSRQAPQGFVYALKASRFLTHRKKLKDPQRPLANMLGRARRLGPHLGPILYQLPPRWHCDLERLRQFIAFLPHDLHHVFEFRDSSWCNEEVRALLDEEGMGFCVHDMRGVDCPAWATGPLAYIRFHGAAALKYTGRYSLDELHRWAERVEELAHDGRDVYVYFNNDGFGHAVINARELQELLHLVPVSAPATTEDA